MDDKEKLFLQKFQLVLFLVNKNVQLKLWSEQSSEGEDGLKGGY